MVGLMPQGNQGVAPEADYQGEPNVAPEEQAMYDKFVDNGLNMISNEKTTKQIMARIKESDPPAEGLAAATVHVAQALVQSAEKDGQEITEDVVFHGMLELLEAIAEVSKVVGIHEFTTEEMESALYIAMDKYGTMQADSGKVDKEALAGDVQRLQEADQSGQLDELFGPGFTEQAQSMGQRG